MDELQSTLKYTPFRVHEPNGRLVIHGGGRDFLPEEITAMLISKMKVIAEAYLGERVTHAVITVPACFTDAQRQATKDAGTIAGLTVLRLMNDPTAAALAYGIHQTRPESKVVVYDLGGGTFDVSLLSMKENGVFEVMATAGDACLGGDDFDRRVVEYVVGLERRTWVDLGRLKREAERVKRLLSTHGSATMDIGDLGDGNSFTVTLTRSQFEELNQVLFEQSMSLVKRVLEDAGISKEDVDEIILVGGSTRIPKIQRLLRNYFGKEPSKIHGSEEVVAYGGAVHGAVLGGHKLKKEVALFDVAALSLGIDTYNPRGPGLFAPLIPRNTAIPTTKSQVFTTVFDYQSSVSIDVYEGEDTISKCNHFLGKFELTRILLARRGVPQIEVTFRIDVNGILEVTAADQRTGSSGSITITNHNRARISEDEIQRMIRDTRMFS
ncbi:hypothetical protein E1B28_003769 [Marasmius oreades]|uniref:Heat shock protein 70 n=1 Tax=Marasmius oreades TaxID=181124 RepID=A0A9P7UX90_9AGAR|nr:uncharacterized protein E1B28_003769 [Marasmius oreades]KAG7096325.1 hypothetical protein E1B28_003769 [Marasmius oreades]